MDTRSPLSMKIDTAQRLLMCRYLSGIIPLQIVNEYPKSGGTWLAQMLAEYLQLDFPRNRRPKLSRCIMHGHMLPSSSMKNVICLFRDGRDVMVSSYYHMLFQNEKNPPRLVQRTRAALPFKDYHDIRSNLPAFITYNFRMRENSRNPNKFSWTQFVNAWQDYGAYELRYEDLVSKPYETMHKLISALQEDEVCGSRLAAVIEKYSFERQSRRQPGEENTSSFLRKGQPGDWKDKFTREAAEIFDLYAGTQLIGLGYEQDNSWKDALLLQ